MKKLVLLRHGESEWNRENRFTGWVDVALNGNGVREAVEAGRTLRREGYVFDTAYTSVLKRAIKTLWLVLEEMDLMWIPSTCNWRLNERHYGALQGLNKEETAEKHGMEQVELWRRSFNVRPPALTPDDPRYPGRDPRYAGLSTAEIPLTECLEDTIRRFLPYFHDVIVPAVRSGKRAIVVAHGNTLRSLVMVLDKIPPDKIQELNIPTGIPLVYELADDLTPLRHYYLGDPEAAKRAAQAVADQLIPSCVQAMPSKNEKRGELRPPHPHAASRLSLALRQQPRAPSARPHALARVAEMRGRGGIIPPLSGDLSYLERKWA